MQVVRYPVSTPANAILRDDNACYVGALRTYDAGFTLNPIKGLTISGAVLNLANDYDRASNIPFVFNAWDSGNPARLGRRFSLSVSYAMD